MHRIDGPSATPEGTFTEGSPSGGVPATVVTAPWLNNIQEELMTLLAAAGIEPVKGLNTQVLSALRSLFGGPLTGIQIFLTPGVTNWNVPAGVTKAHVTVIGGAGGGARKSVSPGPSGGAGAGVAEKLCNLTGVTSVSVTVGAGGAGSSVDGVAGSAGGMSSFGGFCSGAGGAGGTVDGNIPTGSMGTGGDLNYSIGSGSIALTSATGAIVGGSGGGGISPFAQTGTATPSNAGCGGGGRTAGTAPNGSNGMVIIKW